MKQLFAARNKLRESSFDEFSYYLERNQNNLTYIDYSNLLQQAFNLYKKDFINYLRLFHKYCPDIVFVELDDGKHKLTVLQQVLRYGKCWELQEIIKIDSRIFNQFSIKALNWVIWNGYNQKDPQNACDMVELIIKNRPSIILGPLHDTDLNPLLESINKQLYKVASLLVSHQCYLLPHKNYSSNELHYLFGNKTPKKYHSQILSLANQLINRNVDPYQRNENGKTVFDLAHPDLKDQLLKMSKNRLKDSQNNSQGKKEQKGNYPHKKNYQHFHGDKNDSYQNNQSKMPKDSSRDQRTNRKNKHEKGSRQENKLKDKSSSANSLEGSSSKNLYKGKVKSEFGGKQIIKENNELLRINIQNTNLTFHQTNSLSFKESSNIGGDSHVVRILNHQQLENQASMIFQKHTLKKEEKFLTQKAEYEKQMRQKKQKTSRVIQSQELKYYLREEILQLTDSIKKSNQAQRPGYTRIFEEIKRRLQQKIPLIKVDIFGSFATNLHLDLSDIDIVIIGKQGLRDPQSKGSREFDFKSHQRKVHEIFQCVCNQLMSMDEFIEEVTYLDKASIPIIKATCKKEYDFKNIDISFQDEQHKGVDSVSLIKQYLQVYPQLNNLMLVLKKFIYETKLFSPYSGGLSSYGLFLMAVALIQYEELINENPQKIVHLNEGKDCNFIQNQKKHLNKQTNKDIHLRTAELLINFLKFYGFKMDFVTQKIILNKPYSPQLLKTIIYNSEWQNEFPPQPKLIIMDPLYEQNNVGKATRRIKEIKMAFQLAFIAIHTNKRCQSKKTCESYKRIKGVKMEQVRFKQNKRPCCILERMFRCTDNFNLQEF